MSFQALNLKAESKLSYKEANSYLSNNLFRTDYKLLTPQESFLRATSFFNQLGNPQDEFRSIHIAGTSGKGSVAYMLNGLLLNHGFRVGLHTSPHVYDIRERFIVNGNLVPKTNLTKQVSAITPVVKKLKMSSYGPPSYYETTTAIAFNVFKEFSLDYAIIETGIGGLHDSTNTIKRQDKLAVINTLGFDHTKLLGNTLAEIAGQKAGILPAGGQGIVLLPDDPQALEAIKKTAKQRQTKLDIVNPIGYIDKYEHGTSTFSYKSENLFIENLTLNLPGKHQINNCIMALRALEYLAERDKFKINVRVVRDFFCSMQIPGRFEKLSIFGQEYIFDGAHNLQKISALLDSVKVAGYVNTPWIISIKRSQNNQEILKLISQVTNDLTITTVSGVKSKEQIASLNKIAETAKAAGIKNVRLIEDSVEALKLSKSNTNSNQPIIVTGSFYLLGELQNRLVRQGA